MRIWRGSPYPLGATFDGAGVNFALFSENAHKVELCLFDDPADAKEAHRIELHERTYGVWHGYFPDIKPGQVYGYRVHGPYLPEEGHRFNPAKLLLDPYAKAIARNLAWDDALFGYRVGGEREDLTIDDRDSAAFAPLAQVVDTAFTWGNDVRPRTPWERTIIYEAHVKGLTKLMPGVPEELRGTYAGLASEAAVKHLTELGITAIELLPVQYHVDERFLVEQGRVNYWGYNTLGFFSPDPRYCSSSDPAHKLDEFKSMVRTLHQAGIEVILDVVYNHTAEGNHLGPTLSFKGIDNRSYYHLSPEHPRYYMDFTGCGNTPNTRHPRGLQLMMDSLRYWVSEMHVDGFRFDLAATLGRDFRDVDHAGAFFNIIHQDPVLSQVKLIAEPWDVGPGGYQVGNFPVIWTEWNGRYRDSIRKFWKGDGGLTSEFATRLAGSSDLYQDDGRRPSASVNFITCHDGFTLCDLVSYDHKHNEANGENNRDGANDNHSWNCGAEGPTEDPVINALRERQKRNFLATLLLSQGVPMLLAGDEISHSQLGNNNGYSQDNELSWLNWEMTPAKQSLLDFTRRLIQIRREQPTLQRRRFFHGQPIFGRNVKDIYWLDNHFQEMTQEAWDAGFVKAMGVVLNGQDGEVDERGRVVRGDNLLLLLNAHWEPIEFHFPKVESIIDEFERLFDTAEPDAEPGPVEATETYIVHGRSTALFRWTMAGVEGRG